MDVLEVSATGFADSGRHRLPTASAPISRTLTAPALTVAAAVAGLIEVLLVRVAGPVLTHAAGPALAPVAAIVSRVGTLAVAVTAVLIGMAALAWAWREPSRIVAVALLAAVGAAVAAGLGGDPSILTLLHLSVVTAAVGVVLVRRPAPGYRVAIAAVALAVVAGQLAGLSSGFAVAAGVVAEAALVVAMVLFAATISRPLRRGAVLGLVFGGLVAALALMSAHTPLVALWASGATLWMPSVVYIGAGSALGLLLTTWLPARSTRHLAAGLALLVVAGMQPAFIHHNVTALLALVALTATAEGSAPWQ